MKSSSQILFASHNEASPGPVVGEERVIWSGGPSQVVNLINYILLGAAIIASFWLCFHFNGGCLFVSVYAIPRMIFIYLKTRCTKFTFTNQRIKIRSGILSRVTKEIELYRIKDVHLFEPFLLRLFKRGDIRLVSSQKTSNVFIIPGVSDPEQLREEIRLNVERRRMEKGVGELDTGI